MLFNRLAHGPSQSGAIVKVVTGAHRRDRHHLEVLVGVHVAHGHQRAVFGRQRGRVMRQCFHALLVAHLCQNAPQLGVAREGERQVADEVRQLVAGVHALPVRRAVEVVVGVDQPVRVEHHQRVDAQFAAAAADLAVAVDGVLARAVAVARQLAQVERRHVRDLGGKGELSHGQFLDERFRACAPARCCARPARATARETASPRPAWLRAGARACRARAARRRPAARG